MDDNDSIGDGELLPVRLCGATAAVDEKGEKERLRETKTDRLDLSSSSTTRKTSNR